MITYDRSTRSVVAICTCGWRDVATTYPRVAAAALAHMRKAHDEISDDPTYHRTRIAASRR